SYQANNEVIMKPNPGYTAPRGNVGTLIMKQIADPAQQAQLLESGSINFAQSLTWSQFKSLSSSSSVKVYPCAGFSTDNILLQQTYTPLANAKVRQAISMATSRQALVTGAYAGFGTPSLSAWIPSMAPGVTQPQFTEDASAAKSLLAQAGYPNGFPLTLEYNA